MQHRVSSTSISRRSIARDGVRLGLLQGWLPLVVLIARRYSEWQLTSTDLAILTAPFFLGALAVVLILLGLETLSSESEMMITCTGGLVLGCSLLCLPTSDIAAQYVFWALASFLLGFCPLRCAFCWLSDVRSLTMHQLTCCTLIASGIWAVSAAVCLVFALSCFTATAAAAGAGILSFALWRFSRTKNCDQDALTFTSATVSLEDKEAPQPDVSDSPASINATRTEPDASKAPRKTLLLAAGSAALLGVAFAIMMSRFLLAEHGRAGTYVGIALVVGTGLGGLLLVIALRVRPDRPALMAYQLLAIPIIVAFFPLNPGSTFSLHFAFFFSSVALACLMAIVLPLAADYAKLHGISFRTAALAIAAGLSSGALAGCLENLVRQQSEIEPSIYPISITSIVLIIGCVIATNFMLTNHVDRTSPALPTTPAISSPQSESTLAQRCQAAANKYALTRREAEVLELLAQGHSLSYVQAELHISEGTAISHRRSIYKKMLVHSRDELIVAVGAAAEERQT